MQILWITLVGAQWRNLESRYPPWQSVYYYFRLWSQSGLWDDLLAELVKLERKRHIIVDSLGLLVAIFISQADLHDGQGGIELLWQVESLAQNLELIVGDKAYGGEFKKVSEGVYGWKVDTSQRPPGSKAFVQIAFITIILNRIG